MTDSTSYLRITNEQLRADMQKMFYGDSVAATLVKLNDTLQGQQGALDATAEATSEMAATRSVEVAEGG